MKKGCTRRHSSFLIVWGYQVLVEHRNISSVRQNANLSHSDCAIGFWMDAESSHFKKCLLSSCVIGAYMNICYLLHLFTWLKKFFRRGFFLSGVGQLLFFCNFFYLYIFLQLFCLWFACIQKYDGKYDCRYDGKWGMMESESMTAVKMVVLSV